MIPLRHSSPSERFAIHLNDHRALGAGELALAERSRSAHVGTALGHDLTLHIGELATDLALLDDLLDWDGARIDGWKTLGAQLAERVGRLKRNGQLTGSSPLSPVVELEGLVAGCHARATLWSTLADAGFLPDDLSGRARDRAAAVDGQLDVLGAHLADAVSEAFDGVGGDR